MEFNFEQYTINNNLIIGERDTGKTSCLKKVVNEALDMNYKVLVFDSATDHYDKSLIIYCQNKHKGYFYISSPEQNLITDKICKSSFPYNQLVNHNKYNLYLFDVSRYLEEGFLTNNLIEREEIRKIYQKLVIQILYVSFEFFRNNNCIVIMDEIELTLESYEIVQMYNNEGIFFVDAVHSLDRIDNQVSELFQKINLYDKYR